MSHPLAQWLDELGRREPPPPDPLWKRVRFGLIFVSLLWLAGYVIAAAILFPLIFFGVI